MSIIWYHIIGEVMSGDYQMLKGIPNTHSFQLYSAHWALYDAFVFKVFVVWL